jgi:hypothetical protein
LRKRVAQPLIDQRGRGGPWQIFAAIFAMPDHNGFEIGGDGAQCMNAVRFVNQSGQGSGFRLAQKAGQTFTARKGEAAIKRHQYIGSGIGTLSLLRGLCHLAISEISQGLNTLNGGGGSEIHHYRYQYKSKANPNSTTRAEMNAGNKVAVLRNRMTYLLSSHFLASPINRELWIR